MIELAEHDLTRQSVGGDGDALAELLGRGEERLRRRIAVRIPRRHRTAFDEDDVLQVTYIEAFLRVGGFRSTGPASFRAWIDRIAQNNLKDAIKDLERQKRPPRKRQVFVSSSNDSSGCQMELAIAVQDTPSQDAIRDEDRVLLERALRALPDDYEAVVRLFDLQGHSAVVVAESMGRSAGAVHMLRARAHDRLAELLGESTAIFPRRA